MQPHAILAARDLGGIGSATDDRADDGGVARRFGRGSDDDAVAEPESGVGGQPLVNRNGPRGALRLQRAGEERNEREYEADGQRRAVSDQCAVSLSDSRVSTIVYDGAL